MIRWTAAGVAVVLLLPVLVIGAAVGGIGSGAGIDGRSETPADIPAAVLGPYREAADRFGVPVAVLAAVGKVECDHGRDPACGVPNAAGAVGPMQFMPATFAAYAWASGSATPSILDRRDAIFAAAAKLSGDGVVADPAGALYAYNHDHEYVARVMAWALAYGWAPQDPGGPAAAGVALLGPRAGAEVRVRSRSPASTPRRRLP